jgi:sugar transferase (PEP-CTERM/EpsH1 system associated)
LQAEVRNALSRCPYDRIFIYCSAMAQYVPSGNSIPMMVDLVDVDSDKWSQYAAHTRFPFSTIYRREGRTLKSYERSVCERADCVLVSTEREAQLARKIAPVAHVHVLSNGVDTEYFRPAHEAASQSAVIFTGDMSYFPNEEAVVFFARRVLPLIQREVGGARFLIVGRNPSRKVQGLRGIEGVEVSGFVPDIRTWLARARVAVAPFAIAAGIQNKILEALASGLPVVATSTAAQGLSPRVADVVHIGNTAAELAAKVVVLLRDSHLAKRIGLDGRLRVTEDYNWEHALGRLMELLKAPDIRESGVNTSRCK